MIDDNQVARGKRIQQRTGRTFHLATRLLPERIRHPTYVLYGFFRIADEIVDAAETGTPDEQRAELERLRDVALGEAETEDPVLEAFATVREEYGIAEDYVHSFIDAMQSDIDRDRYETYEDLRAYMDGSAAAVGRMMTTLMDPDDEAKALPHATTLGEAFQMTNFLRDVREDAVELNRVYLPEETLRANDVDPEQILALEFDENVAAAICSEVHRTERLYREGVAGIQYLPEDCQLAVLFAAVLYADHHKLIRDRGYDTVSATPDIGFYRSVRLFVKTRWHWLWTDDPELAFRKVLDGFGPEPPHGHGPGNPAATQVE